MNKNVINNLSVLTYNTITMDLRLKHNASMLVAGPTQSGKTTFIRKLIDYRSILFDKPPNQVYWFYGIYQPKLHEDLRRLGAHVEEGLTGLDQVKPNSLVVIDDLMNEVNKSGSGGVTNLFTRVAHHKNCFVILATQNLFSQGKDSVTQRLNTQYMVLFKNPHDSLQIRILGSRMFPGKANFLPRVFQDATSRPHGYLLIDSVQNTDDSIRLRTCIFPDEYPMITYQHKL